MTKDIAIQLAKITGKPVEDFYVEIREDVPRASIGAREESSSEDKNDIDLAETGVSALAPLLPAQKQSSHNSTKTNSSKIVRGKQLTRKEYLAEVKGKTREEICDSPLLYKLFRAEGQLEPSFPNWLNQFPSEEEDGEEYE